MNVKFGYQPSFLYLAICYFYIVFGIERMRFKGSGFRVKSDYFLVN